LAKASWRTLDRRKSREVETRLGVCRELDFDAPQAHHDFESARIVDRHGVSLEQGEITEEP
jgi:hypothetical protein